MLFNNLTIKIWIIRIKEETIVTIFVCNFDKPLLNTTKAPFSNELCRFVFFVIIFCSYGNL